MHEKNQNTTSSYLFSLCIFYSLESYLHIEAHQETEHAHLCFSNLVQSTLTEISKSPELPYSRWRLWYCISIHWLSIQYTLKETQSTRAPYTDYFNLKNVQVTFILFCLKYRNTMKSYPLYF